MEKTKNIFAIILSVIGIICTLYALIMQPILAYQKFGVIFGNMRVIIPDKSLFGLLGIIPMGIGGRLLMTDIQNKKKGNKK